MPTPIVMLLAGLAVLPMAARCPGQPLRYQFQPGQTLTYHIQSSAIDARGQPNFSSSTRIDLWVLDEAEGGGWTMLLRQTLQTANPAQKQPKPPHELLARFVLHPDGRIGPSPDINGYRTDPRLQLPRLPSADEGEWSHDNADIQRRIDYRRAGANPVVIHANLQSDMDRVYGVQRNMSLHFDPGRGRVIQFEGTYRQTYGTPITGSQRGTLASEAAIDDQTLIRLRADAQAFFLAREDYFQAVHEAIAATQTDARLEQAGRRLDQAQAQVTHPAVARQLDFLSQRHQRRVKTYRKRARRRAAMVGRPAPDWTLVDLSGRERRLADLRGRTVILDFWYRACPPCVKNMPQMNRITERLAGPEVIVLGMNTDLRAKDARFVADVMHLKYPSVRARSVAAAYQVEKFPTLLVIGPDGVIRDYHEGYSTRLAAQIVEQVERIRPAAGNRSP